MVPPTRGTQTQTTGCRLCEVSHDMRAGTTLKRTCIRGHRALAFTPSRLAHTPCPPAPSRACGTKLAEPVSHPNFQEIVCPGPKPKSSPGRIGNQVSWPGAPRDLHKSGSQRSVCPQLALTYVADHHLIKCRCHRHQGYSRHTRPTHTFCSSKLV